jgi:hypothetical protein
VSLRDPRDGLTGWCDVAAVLRGALCRLLCGCCSCTTLLGAAVMNLMHRPVCSTAVRAVGPSLYCGCTTQNCAEFTIQRPIVLYSIANNTHSNSNSNSPPPLPRDVFSLVYHTKPPLDAVFTPAADAAYRRYRAALEHANALRLTGSQYT